MTPSNLPASEDFREAFAAADATQPVVLWRPETRDCRYPVIRRFASLCNGLRDESGHIPVDRFQAADLGDLQDYLAIATPCPDSPDFRFVSFGPRLFAARGRDLTDRTTGMLDPHLRQFLNALSGAAMRSGFWVLSIHEPVRKVFASDRVALTVPLVDPNGTAVQVARLTINQNALLPGLNALPDPALIIRPDQQVIYANGQAEALFGARPFLADPVCLSDYCGFALDIDMQGSVKPDMLRHLQTKSLRNGIVVTSDVTLRTVLFRDQPFGIVIIRPG